MGYCRFRSLFLFHSFCVWCAVRVYLRVYECSKPYKNTSLLFRIRNNKTVMYIDQNLCGFHDSWSLFRYIYILRWKMMNKCLKRSFWFCDIRCIWVKLKNLKKINEMLRLAQLSDCTVVIFLSGTTNTNCFYERPFIIIIFRFPMLLHSSSSHFEITLTVLPTLVKFNLFLALCIWHYSLTVQSSKINFSTHTNTRILIHTYTYQFQLTSYWQSLERLFLYRMKLKKKEKNLISCLKEQENPSITNLKIDLNLCI